MKKENKLYEIIYNEILSDIIVGYYMYGDNLPTMEQLCDQYDVGINTARKALTMLQDEGYIKMGRGIKPYVRYREEPSGKRHIRLIAQKKSAVMDLQNTIYILMSDWLTNASYLSNPEISAKLERTIYDINPWHQPLKEVYSRTNTVPRIMLSCLNNPLITNLYDSMIRFLSIPYINEKNIANPHVSCAYLDKEGLYKFAYDFSNKNYDELTMVLKYVYESDSEKLRQYFDSLMPLQTNYNDITFEWRFNIGKSFAYSEIAVDIIRKINEGIYKDGCFLPSVRVLLGNYDVSEITVRGALKLLSSVGLVECIDGNYKVMFAESKTKNLKITNSFVISQLKNFVYNLQIVLMNMDNIILESYRSVETGKNDLINKNWVKAENNFEKCCVIQSLFDVLCHSIKSPSMRTIFVQLSKQMYMGGCFCLFNVTTDIEYKMEEKCNIIVEGFKADDIDAAISGYKEYYKLVFAAVKCKLNNMGIHDVDDISMPKSFR